MPVVEKSATTPAHATSPDCYNDHASEGACGFSDLRQSVFAYLKDPDALPGADIRQGPLAEYTLEHAALYRKRS
jgi:hypothetical protein